MGRTSNPKAMEEAKEMVAQGKTYAEINTYLKKEYKQGISPNTITNMKKELKEKNNEKSTKKEIIVSSEVNIFEVGYEEKFNTNNYDNKKFSLSATISPKTNPTVALFKLKLKIDKAFKIIQYYDTLVKEKEKIEKNLKEKEKTLVPSAKEALIERLEALSRQIKMMNQKKEDIEAFMINNYMQDNEEEPKS